MNTIVTIVGGQAVTTTPTIADGTAVDHASVIKLVRTYRLDLEEFGGVGFEIQPFETAGGTQQREIACLNEQQATLVMTYMRNSDIVREFKKRLVKAFWDMARQLTQPVVPQSLPEALRLAADLADQKAKAEAALAEAQPKVQGFDLIAAGEKSITIREAAKLLDIKEKTLTSWLHEHGWVYRLNGRWVAKQEHISGGRLIYKEARYTDQNTGHEVYAPYCHITPKGLAKLAREFGNLQMELAA